MPLVFLSRLLGCSIECLFLCYSFQHVFNPKHVPTLAFLALLQPLGAIMPIAEMQSRWIVKVITVLLQHSCQA